MKGYSTGKLTSVHADLLMLDPLNPEVPLYGTLKISSDGGRKPVYRNHLPSYIERRVLSLNAWQRSGFTTDGSIVSEKKEKRTPDTRDLKSNS